MAGLVLLLPSTAAAIKWGELPGALVYMPLALLLAVCLCVFAVIGLHVYAFVTDRAELLRSERHVQDMRRMDIEMAKTVTGPAISEEGPDPSPPNRVKALPAGSSEGGTP